MWNFRFAPLIQPSIRARLITLIFACALPMLVGYVVLARDSAQREREHVAGDARTIAEVLAAAVDREIAIGQATANVISNGRSIQRADLASFHAMTQRVLRNEFPARAVLLHLPDGTALLDSRHPFGTPLAQADNVNDIRQVAASGKTLASGLHRLGGEHKVALSVEVPVWQEEKVAYVLSILLRPRRLADLLDSQHLPGGWVAEVYDRRLHLVARSPADGAFLDAPMESALRNSVVQHGTGTIDTVDMRGKAGFAAYAHSPKYGWVVAVRYPHDAASTMLGQSMPAMLAAIAAVLALGVGLAWKIGGGIGDAMRALARPAADLGSGAPLQLAPSGIREVDAVADAMVRVDAELRDNRNRLEARVADRTRELERSKAQLEIVYASAPAGLCFMDTDLRIVMVNDYLAAINALPAQDHIGYTLPELLGEVGEVFERAYRQVIETAQPLVALEESDAAPGIHGELRHWMSSYYPVFGPDGALMGVNAVVLDVTERKQLQQRERDHQEMFRALFDTAGDAHLLVAYGAGYVSANQAAANMFGFAQPGELLDESPVSLSPARQDNGSSSEALALSHMRRALHQGHAQFEWRHRRRDGSTFDAEVFLTRVDIGGVGIMQATVRDISARVAADKALRAAGAQLEQALQLAEQASRAKGEFLANMSHELRTPLNAIVGLASLLEESRLGPKEQRHVTRIRTAARSLLGMLNDLLDYSRVESGQLKLEKIDFRLDDVLDSIAALSVASAWSKGVEPVFAVAPDVPQLLRGDPLRLEQVLLNLFGNAVKFTERGEIVLAIDLLAMHDDVAEIRFTVRDTGIGIAPDVQERIFDAFTQADNSTVRKYGGTGLGLSIARRLVELSGGQLTLSSHPGAGATFGFIVRLDVQPHADGPAEAGPALGRVLIADDNAASRQALAAQCRAWQATVDEADNGQAMFALLNQAHYDLVLIDSAMPDIDGVAALARSREQHPHAMGRIGLLVPDPDATRFHELAAALSLDFVISKPFTAHALHTTLRQASDGAFARPALAHQAGAASLQGLRVLLVEDNEINQEVGSAILHHAGAEVDIAANGQAALSMLAVRSSYDVVLMDLQMPVMNGFEAAQAIRASGWDMPIVAMTANALEQDRQRALASGMQAHLLKPIDVAQLVTTLRQVCGRARDPASVATPAPLPHPANVPGIDLKETLPRFAGSFERFAALLARFVDGNEAVLTELRGHIDAGQRRPASGVAHRLRGVAANLGARDVARAAQTLEFALYDADAGTVLLRLAALEQALQELHEVSRQLVHTAPLPQQAPLAASGGAVLGEALERLLQLLINNNMKAITEMEQLNSTLAACAGAQSAAQLVDLVATLQFDKAADRVRLLLTEMGEA